MNILIVEDDTRVADFLERGLKAEGYRIRLATTGTDGLEACRNLWEEQSQTGVRGLVLLDLMLPGMNGLDLCQTLRASHINLPILMLTALGRIEDRVAGLRMGADDYMVKPFGFEELLARIEALFRRGPLIAEPVGAVLKVGDLELDRSRFSLHRSGEEIRLTTKELALLELLMSSPGRVFSRQRILTNVWGIDEDPLTNVVDVYIRRLRSKVDEPFGTSLIETVRGVGYRVRG
ncbi:response regulator transcription factor [Hyphomonas sp.]|jgi:DNA-binding response OmpR family regulator|uniref:response regulator transcription factor n=1 Tax=Hyphomonas sp. TaxID=87 RepID=UPI000A9C18F3|nr:response regulator transcription factor [Hyphomonas sp.]MBA4340311.1 DNA-binding response regulator [Hyphomonas sp.]